MTHVIGSLLAIAVQLMVPLAWASCGEILCERSGVLNVGLEGAILVGALAAAVAFTNTNSFVAATAFGILVGAALGMILSFLYVWRGVDQVIGGVVLYLLSSGLTAAAWTKLQGPYVGRDLAALPIPGLYNIPLIGAIAFDQNIFVYGCVCFAVLLDAALRNSRLGKNVRAAGEAPEAVDSVGLSVRWIRTWSLTAGTALGALGGVSLVLTSSSGRFVPNMAGGIGFVALGVTLLVRWRPTGALVAAFGFGCLQAFRYTAQSSAALDFIPVEAILALPYVAAIILVAVSRGSRYPAAMGGFWRGGGH